jgi:DegV family protein with EDD domain
MRIAIVTDSTADIPEEIAEKLNITVIPTILIIDGQQYDDGEGISRQEFYERLPEMNPHPTTSAPSAGTFQQAYADRFAEGYDKIISIHAPAQLSGIFNAASLAAQEFSGQVEVIDSGQLSLGMGHQVIAAAEAALEGQSSEAIMATLTSTRKRTVLYAMLDTMDQLRRSGRVSWAKASLGSLLQIKLFIELKDGQVHRIAQLRTRTKGMVHFKKLLQELGPLERLAMLHTNAEAEARAVFESLNLSLASEPLYVFVTTVIGTHVGPNAIGFAAVMAE